MVNGKQFEKEVKRNQVYFAIIPRKPSFVNGDWLLENNVNRVPANGDRVKKDSDSRVPKEIIELLNEYKEIIVDDILDGLHLLRSISHFMDLILEASFPNKALYRLTPSENE